MLEVEQKFRVANRQALLDRIAESGAEGGDVQQHVDTYFQHPCRDFVQTNEALRIRAIDSLASVTYKGPKMALSDATLKAREEIEWSLAPADADGTQMRRLLIALGFRLVKSVEKQRRTFSWPEGEYSYSRFTLTVDDVRSIGCFAEIEFMMPMTSRDDRGAIDQAGCEIRHLADRLGLGDQVAESYLEMVLASDAT